MTVIPKSLVGNADEIKKFVSEGRNYGQVNPFAGTEYEQLWINNPYRNTYLDPTFWDNIGLSNKSRDYNAEQQRLYNEYIAGIYELQQQNQYNSESAKAARMRAAGQNPDLLGLNNASESDNLSAPASGPSPTLNGQSPAIGSLQMLGSVMSFALNAYQGITSTLNAVDAQNIQNIESLVNAARPYVTQSFAEYMFGGSDAVKDDYKTFGSLYNRRNRRSAENAFKSLFSGNFPLQTDAYQNQSKYFDASIGFEAREYFKGNDAMNSVDSFIEEMVKLGVEEYRMSKKKNISTATKEKLLNDFRSRSIERLRKNWEDSDQTDLLSGLLLIGMLESTGTSFFTSPSGYMTAISRIGLDYGKKKVKNYLGLD